MTLENVYKSLKSLAPVYDEHAPHSILAASTDVVLDAVRQSGVTIYKQESATAFGSLFGFPIRIDGSLPPNEIRIIAQDGRVLTTIRNVGVTP